MRGMSARRTSQRVVAPGRERARRALERYRPVLEGKRVFFFPDSQLETVAGAVPGPGTGHAAA